MKVFVIEKSSTLACEVELMGGIGIDKQMH